MEKDGDKTWGLSKKRDYFAFLVGVLSKSRAALRFPLGVEEEAGKKPLVMRDKTKKQKRPTYPWEGSGVLTRGR